MQPIHPNRPQFSDDPTPDPAAAVPEPEKTSAQDALDIAARQLAYELGGGARPIDPPPDVDLPRTPPPTQKQASAIAEVLFEPTLKRMVTLTNSLVNSTSSGDFAVFMPLATLMEAIRQINYEESPPAARARAYLLAHHALQITAEKYRRAVTAIRNGEKDAPVEVWGQADTIACYQELEKELPSGILDEPEPGLTAALLVDIGIPGTYEEVEALCTSWTKEQLKLATEWAMDVAQNGPDKVTLKRPVFMPEIEKPETES